MRRLLIAVLFLPLALGFLGDASNQLVIVANHGKFPVELNPVWTENQAPDADGMLDRVHCVMNDSTRLNILADIFNRHTKIISIGDILQDFSVDIQPYCFGFCFALFLCIPFTKAPVGYSTPRGGLWGQVVQGKGPDSISLQCRGFRALGHYPADSTR